MAKCIDPHAGFSLKDLMSDDGLVLDFGNEFEEEDDERYKYNPKANITDDELIKYMNFELSDNEDEEDAEDNSSIPLGLNFDRIKPKMENITPDGKIKKLVRQKGVGELVPIDSMVTIKYSGYFEGQDEPYDSTFLRGAPSSYRLNRGELIYGLDLAIRSMKKHEASIFLIHSNYAYGEIGFLPLIPGNAEVMFLVYLVDFLDNGAAETFEALDSEERSLFKNAEKYAEHLMTTGADNFKRGYTKKAIRDYRRAIDRLEDAKLDNENEERHLHKLISKAATNLAVCYNKEDMPRKACIACNRVINKTAKTHFHYGRALIKMGEYNQALENLELALKKDPHSSDIIKEMRLANELYNKSIDEEKRMWSSCLKIKNLKISEKDKEYEELAKEFCTNFQSNEHVMRQAVPEDLSVASKEAIRKQALALGISVTVHKRYNKGIIYLEKPNYM